MSTAKLIDPKWTEISASRRDNKMWIKMPTEKAQEICEALQVCGGDLKAPQEIALVGTEGKSIVILNSVDEWQKDLDNAGLTDSSPQVLIEFVTALRQGMDQNPAIDWIARMAALAENSENFPQL